MECLMAPWYTWNSYLGSWKWPPGMIVLNKICAEKIIFEAPIIWHWCYFYDNIYNSADSVYFSCYSFLEQLWLGMWFTLARNLVRILARKNHMSMWMTSRVTAIRNTTPETKLCKPSMDIPLRILLFYNLSIHLMSTMMETMGASPCGLQFLKL